MACELIRGPFTTSTVNRDEDTTTSTTPTCDSAFPHYVPVHSRATVLRPLLPSLPVLHLLDLLLLAAVLPPALQPLDSRSQWTEERGPLTKTNTKKRTPRNEHLETNIQDLRDERMRHTVAPMTATPNMGHRRTGSIQPDPSTSSGPSSAQSPAKQHDALNEI